MANNPNEPKSVNNSDYQFELYKQLHEQYAENDNNKTQNVISFLAAIFVVFVGYGVSLLSNNDQMIILATIAAQSMLVLLGILCLYFGYSTRRDQFIIHKIRTYYNLKLPYTDPFDRPAKMWSFLPDYYAIMFYACLFFWFSITFVFCVKIKGMENYGIFCLIDVLFFILIIVRFWYFYYEKYKEFRNRECVINDENK